MTLKMHFIAARWYLFIVQNKYSQPLGHLPQNWISVIPRNNTGDTPDSPYLLISCSRASVFGTPRLWIPRTGSSSSNSMFLLVRFDRLSMISSLFLYSFMGAEIYTNALLLSYTYFIILVVYLTSLLCVDEIYGVRFCYDFYNLLRSINGKQIFGSIHMRVWRVFLIIYV